MMFYKIEAELPALEPLLEKAACSERAAAMQTKIESRFMAADCVCFITVSSILDRKKKAMLCAAVKKGVLAEAAVKDFLKALDLEPGGLDIQEITLEIYFRMLQSSDRNGYIDDDDDVCEKLGIADLNARYRHLCPSFSESVLAGAATKKELLRSAEDLLCDGSLAVEIERIYQGAQEASAAGHPVHYMLQCDDRDARGQMLHTLLTALHQNGRIQSRRYTELCYDSDDSLHESRLKTLYESCADGAVVVSFAEEDEEDSEHARTGADVIEGLCAVMRRYRNQVLTIFCIQRRAEMVKNAFLEHLGAVTIVQMCQETVFDARAKAYLRARAKEHNAAADRALYRPIAQGKGYSAADLNLIFDEWYDRRLKSKVYTQYAALETANKLVAARKPKGYAIDELERMIGLRDAKQVIHQALDFYKAQKLFREKGFTGERPAMHMVFTGSPGTAKTSVARLFAQIMKDNGLLSVGDLHEVGRADLVGKYVGWTAQIVKKKLRAARGSVLFIDEAYSLVDDRGGLYGDEAINTIVQEMENHREDMIVIFAGYTNEMEGFLQKNPGLRSRIAFHVPFADYNAQELLRITALLAAQKQLTLDGAAQEKLLPIFEAAMQTEDFGNGRFARNLLEKAIMKQAGRLVAMDIDNVTKSDIGLLLAEDFEAPAQEKKAARHTIGFVA